MASCQNILATFAKRQAQPAVNHLTVKQTAACSLQPTGPPRQGRRDATLLDTLYDTSARLQELADLAVRDIRLQPQPWLT